jgi:predicted peroxiredoxin
MQIVTRLLAQMDGRSKMKKKAQRKTKMSGRAKHRTASYEVYDTEVHCAKYGARLYVSRDAATQVLASLRSTGMAGLVCLCGHTQFIDVAFRSVVVRMHKRRHD